MGLVVHRGGKNIMSDFESLSHSRWDCKYHVVFIPKGRKKELYGKIRKFLGPVFRELAGQKGCKIEEGHMVSDHVHILIKIPPKYPISDLFTQLSNSTWGVTTYKPCSKQKRYHLIFQFSIYQQFHLLQQKHDNLLIR